MPLQILSSSEDIKRSLALDFAISSEVIWNSLPTVLQVTPLTVVTFAGQLRAMMRSKVSLLSRLKKTFTAKQINHQLHQV